jgi:hypothetical protein
MLPDYLLRIALIIILLMVSVKPARAVGEVVYHTSGVPGYFPTVAQVCSAHAAAYSFPASCLSYDEVTLSYVVRCAAGYCAATARDDAYTTTKFYNCATGYSIQPCTNNCPADGTLASEKWIKTGTDPNSIYTVGNGTFCNNGCQTKSFLSIPRNPKAAGVDGAWKLVDGVRTYYSFREYAYTGQTCATGDGTEAAAAAVPPTDTCAPGQSSIQMGSRIKCIDPSTGQQVSPNSASAVAAAKTASDQQIADNIKAAMDAAASAVAAAGGSASAVEAARTNAAAAAAAGAASGVSVVGGGKNTENHLVGLPPPRRWG